VASCPGLPGKPSRERFKNCILLQQEKMAW